MSTKRRTTPAVRPEWPQAYTLTCAIDLPRSGTKEMNLDLRFYPSDEQEFAEYEAVAIALRDGLRAAGREASLALVSKASEVVA
jgi:hypothetical protein